MLCNVKNKIPQCLSSNYKNAWKLASYFQLAMENFPDGENVKDKNRQIKFSPVMDLFLLVILLLFIFMPNTWANSLRRERK